MGQAFLFEKGAELVDVLLGDDGDGDVDAWVDLLALFELQDRLDARDPFLERILLYDGDDPAVIDAFDRLGGEVPAEDFDFVGALLTRDRRNRADKRRLARSIKGVHVGVGGHQILSGRQGDVLDVLTVDCIEELDIAAGFSGRLEAVEPLVLDERVKRADNADLGCAGHLALNVVGKILANLFARALVVDADEGRVVAIRDPRIDCYDRDARLLGRGDCGFDAVDVDGDENDAVDLLRDVVLDRAVLRRSLVVGVENDELGSRLVCRLLGSVIDLIEEQRLLIDRHKSDRFGVRRRADESRLTRQKRSKSPTHHRSCHFTLPLLKRMRSGVLRSRHPSVDFEPHSLDETGSTGACRNCCVATTKRSRKLRVAS